MRCHFARCHPDQLKSRRRVPSPATGLMSLVRRRLETYCVLARYAMKAVTPKLVLGVVSRRVNYLVSSVASINSRHDMEWDSVIRPGCCACTDNDHIAHRCHTNKHQMATCIRPSRTLLVKQASRQECAGQIEQEEAGSCVNNARRAGAWRGRAWCLPGACCAGPEKWARARCAHLGFRWRGPLRRCGQAAARSITHGHRRTGGSGLWRASLWVAIAEC